MKSFLSLLILWFFCQACYFSPALRTGRTLEKGQQQIGANISTFVAPDDTDETVVLPIPEAYFASGLTDKIDIIGKISLASVHTEARYQFLGDKVSSFAGSAGLGVSLSFFAFNIFDVDENFLTLTPTVPLFFSYHPSDKFAVYVSPRYSILALIGNEPDGIPGIFSMAGGIEIGNQFVVNLEGGFQSFHSFTTGTDNEAIVSSILPQFSIGFGYRFGGKR